MRARQGANNWATRVPMRPRPTRPMVWPANPSEAAAADVIGEIFRGAPFARAHIGVALGDFLQQREHEGDGRFGDAEAVGFGRRVAHHDAEVGCGLGVDVVDTDGVFRDDAQPLRCLHDAPADRGVTHGGAHERDCIARGLHHRILVRRARQLPVAIPDDDFTAHAFERLDGLWRLLPRGKDQNFRLGHERSVVDGPGKGAVLRPKETAGGMRRDQLSWMPLSLNT